MLNVVTSILLECLDFFVFCDMPGIRGVGLRWLHSKSGRACFMQSCSLFVVLTRNGFWGLPNLEFLEVSSAMFQERRTISQ